MRHVGAGLPVASSREEYSRPTAAGLRVVVVITGAVQSGGLLILRVNFFVALPMEFAAFTVNEYEPAADGVPEIVPSVARVIPSGSLPPERVHVMGVVPEAVRVCV